MPKLVQTGLGIGGIPTSWWSWRANRGLVRGESTESSDGLGIDQGGATTLLSLWALRLRDQGARREKRTLFCEERVSARKGTGREPRRHATLHIVSQAVMTDKILTGANGGISPRLSSKAIEVGGGVNLRRNCLGRRRDRRGSDLKSGGHLLTLAVVGRTRNNHGWIDIHGLDEGATALIRAVIVVVVALIAGATTLGTKGKTILRIVVGTIVILGEDVWELPAKSLQKSVPRGTSQLPACVSLIDGRQAELRGFILRSTRDLGEPS